MRFELFVALRLLREARFQSLLILTAVAIGVSVVVFLSALIDGLQASLITRTLGSQAHVVVTPPDAVPRALDDGSPGRLVVSRTERAPQRDKALTGWEGVRQVVAAVPGVTATSPVVSGPALATRGAVSRSVALRGIEPESYDRIIHVSQRLVAGTYAVQGSRALIGKELAQDLGLGAGDKLRVVAGEDRSEVLSVGGVFDLGNKDVNTRWVLVALPSAQSLLDVPGGVTAIEATVGDVFAADAAAATMAERTGLEAQSWMQLNAELMIALRSQSSSRYLIELFVVLSMVFGIASVLIVSVVQKSREIGVMKAFGTSTARVLRIFLLQGALVGAAGSVVGCALGAAVALAFAQLVRNPDGSATFPIQITPTLLGAASTIALLVGVGAAALPARRAARLDPAVVIRYG